jgi:hypothetical protein
MERIVVGDVEVRLSGLSFEQVVELLNLMGSIALALGEKDVDEVDEESSVSVAATSIGFHTEIAEVVDSDLSEWFEEE